MDLKLKEEERDMKGTSEGKTQDAIINIKGSGEVVKSQMEDIALDFSRIYGEYYRDQKTDEELLVYTTQPFWQSMGLSKRRLRDKGLTLEVDMIPEKNMNSQVFREHFKANKRPMKYKMKLHEDGQREYGQCVEDVLVRRRFVKNGKRIFKKVESEQHVVTCLKSKVEGEKAVCPNCGYVGTIASYIDGCDACGSKFTVNDFEPKVSGFSFEQNPYIQFRNLALSVNGMMCFIFVFMMLLMTVFMFAASYFKGTSWIGFAGNSMVMAFLSMFIGAPVLVVLMYLFSAITWGLKWVYGKNVRGEDVAQRTMHNMSANDFFQNMEYKIRNIHFAKNEKETNGFAECDVSGVLPKYQDVIDCNMTYLKFIEGKRTPEGYHFDCAARIRTTKYNGKRIRYAYENVKFGVRGKRDVVDKPVTSMRMYVCKNCGRTLNLLEGAACKFCGSEYDLEQYDWVIDGYETKEKKMIWPLFVRIGVLLVYFGVIALVLGKLNIGMDNTIIINGETIYESTETGNTTEEGITEEAP